MSKMIQLIILFTRQCNNQIKDNQLINLNEKLPHLLKKENNQAIKYILPSLLMFFTSCNGLLNTGLVNGNLNDLKTIEVGLPEMINKRATTEWKYIPCSLRDKAGNIWFGTMHGVNRYDGKSLTNFTWMDGLSVDNVTCMMEDYKGNIWFGSVGGVSRYDGKTFTSVKIPRSGEANLFLFKGAPYLRNLPINFPPPKPVTGITQDKNGDIRFETSGGAFRYDEKTLSIIFNNGC